MLDDVLAASPATVLVVDPDEDAVPTASRVWRLEAGRLHELQRKPDAGAELRVLGGAAPASSRRAD